ncbi:MAG: arginine N-succinyltransferase [Verrucomicrobia bacterium]|nr:arginine N-succinyltransferase [Verrucomicrobiota bacterium]
MNAEKPSSGALSEKQSQDTIAIENPSTSPPVSPTRNPIKTFAIVLLALTLIVGGVSAGWYWYYFHARAFSPVELSQNEQLVMDGKLELAGGDAVFAKAGALESNDKAIAVRKEDSRTIIFTEREINGVLHHNTDLADKLYIDLKKDAVIAKIVYPVQEDIAVVGGKTLRANVTMQIYLDDSGKLQIALGDVTVSGIPLPNAWLFDAKGKNLIDLDSGPDGTGLLKRIADGIADFKVEDGQIKIRLNE